MASRAQPVKQAQKVRRSRMLRSVNQIATILFLKRLSALVIERGCRERRHSQYYSKRAWEHSLRDIPLLPATQRRARTCLFARRTRARPAPFTANTTELELPACKSTALRRRAIYGRQCIVGTCRRISGRVSHGDGGAAGGTLAALEGTRLDYAYQPRRRSSLVLVRASH